MKIMTAQRNPNKLIASKQIRESILGNTLSKRVSIRGFNIMKLGEKQKIRKTFEFTEWRGK
jgi:hypothetical protein